MERKKKKKLKNGDQFSNEPSYTALSTLGEALEQTHPEMVRKIQSLQGSFTPVDRLVTVVHDLLPFNWEDPELFEEGVRLLINEQYEKGKEVFQEVVRFNPDAYPAYHLLGHVFGSIKNHKEEIEHYRKAIKIRSDYPQIYYSLAVAYWRMGKEKKAFATLQQAASLTQEFAVADYWLTFIFDRLGSYGFKNRNGRGKLPEKIRVLAQVFYMLGNAHLEFGFHIAARNEYKKAVRLDPNFARGYFQLGFIHIKKLRNPKRAAKYLEKAEQLFIQQNDLQRASLTHQLLHSDKVTEKEKAAKDWLKEGLRLQQLGMCQRAVDSYKMAVDFKPNFVDAFYNMGVAYGSLEERGTPLIHKAIWALKQAVNIKPDFSHAYTALGASYIKSQELGKAVEILETALNYDSEASNALYYLGIAHRMSGNLQGAVDYLRQSAYSKPDSVQVQFYLGLALVDSQRYQEACDIFHEVIRIKPDFADCHFVLGNLYLDKIGDDDKAPTHLRKAEKLFAKLGDYHRAAQIRQKLSSRSS